MTDRQERVYVPIENFPSLPGETWDALKKRHAEAMVGLVTGRPAVRIPRALRGADGLGNDYRDDMARPMHEVLADPSTPRGWNPKNGDPQAYVSGPRSLQRLVDRRQREGWKLRGEAWDDIERRLPKTEAESQAALTDTGGRDLFQESLNEALDEHGGS